MAPVSFTVTTPSSPTGLQVDLSGEVTTSDTLAVNTYTISGTDSDNYGDIGTWSYTLDVTAGTITQTAPFSNGSKWQLTPASSSTFNDQLATTGGVGPVTFSVVTPSNPVGALTVSTSGAVTTSGAPLDSEHIHN